MNKSTPLFCRLAIIISLTIFGCSAKPVRNLPESVPPIVKEYKSIPLRATKSKMVNSGVHLDKGARFSILVEGVINLGGTYRREMKPSIAVENLFSKIGHGLFTAYYLKALEGEADINKDDVVSGVELGAYLRPSTSNAPHQSQTPLYGRLEGEGEFLFFIKNDR